MGSPLLQVKCSWSPNASLALMYGWNAGSLWIETMVRVGLLLLFKKTQPFSPSTFPIWIRISCSCCLWKEEISHWCQWELFPFGEWQLFFGVVFFLHGGSTTWSQSMGSPTGWSISRPVIHRLFSRPDTPLQLYISGKDWYHSSVLVVIHGSLPAIIGLVSGMPFLCFPGALPKGSQEDSWKATAWLPWSHIHLCFRWKKCKRQCSVRHGSETPAQATSPSTEGKILPLFLQLQYLAVARCTAVKAKGPHVHTHVDPSSQLSWQKASSPIVPGHVNAWLLSSSALGPDCQTWLGCCPMSPCLKDVGCLPSVTAAVCSFRPSISVATMALKREK